MQVPFHQELVDQDMLCPQVLLQPVHKLVSLQQETGPQHSNAVVTVVMAPFSTQALT